ncbi:trafficking protein particle complex subunit 2-like protein [Bolinopsis microptera]|uniref:trafficking protein particle complex subunit 2-like protein n=1 Tax=Bolinopsis microptera TaxID=2820187 RepID=UPI003078EFAA
MAVCIAILTKDNCPLYLTCENTEDSLKMHFLVHTSIDVIEEKLNSTKAANDPRDLYLGQLYPNEDYRIFGYVTNTKIKFVVLESVNHPIKDGDIRQLFSRIHSAYISLVCNPFYMPGDPISSVPFKKTISGLLRSNYMSARIS